jgi:hypothetical protein
MASKRLASEMAPALHFMKLQEPKRRQKERETIRSRQATLAPLWRPLGPEAAHKKKMPLGIGATL